MPLLTMYPAKINSPATALSVGISESATSIEVLDATVLPVAPNIAVIGDDEDCETILYTGKTGNLLTGITRSFQGIAKAWVQGTSVARDFTEYDYEVLRTNILNSLSGSDVDTIQGFHASDFATAAQGAKADTSVQPSQVVTNEALQAHLTSYNTRLKSLKRALLEKSMLMDIRDKVFSPILNSFYTDFVDDTRYSLGLIDNFKQYFDGTVSAGAVSIVLPSVTGLSVGDEVSIQDLTKYEERVITSINGTTIGFTGGLTNTYTCPTIYRSSIQNESVFGGLQTTLTTDKTATVALNDAGYTTDRCAKPFKLSDGRIITMVANGTTELRFYIIDEAWTTPVLMGTWTTSCAGGFSFTVMDGWVCAIASSLTNTAYARFLISSVGATLSALDSNVLGVTATAIYGCCIAVNEAGTELSMVVAAKGINSTKSANLFSAVSPDTYNWNSRNGLTAYDILSTLSTNASDHKNPMIMYMGNNLPVVVSQRNAGTSTYYIVSYNYTTAWSSAILITTVSTYAQLMPCLALIKTGTYAGRLICKWNGPDSTNTTKQNQKVSYSANLGVSWSAFVKITTGSTYDRKDGDLAIDLTGKIYCVYNDNGTASYQVSTDGGTTFTGLTTMSVGTLPVCCQTYNYFDRPIIILQTASADKLYGRWAKPGYGQVLKSTVRLEITPSQAVKDITAWTTRSEITGALSTAYISIVDAGQNESYNIMTRTSTAINKLVEDLFLYSAATAKMKVTLKMVYTRAATTDDFKVSSILGGVA